MNKNKILFIVALITSPLISSCSLLMDLPTKLIDNYNSTKACRLKPISNENPTKSQLETLINTYLSCKSAFLAGKENTDFSNILSSSLTNSLSKERQKDISRGNVQLVNVLISSLKVQSRTNKRIVLNVILNYQSKRISSSGEILTETVMPSLKVKYVLERNKDIWQIVDYLSAN